MLKLSKLTQTLQHSLRDAGNKLDTEKTAMGRYIRAAVADLDRVRPRILSTQVILSADIGSYDLPGNARRFHSASWTDKFRAIEPWERPSGLRLPAASVRIAAGGDRTLELMPAPKLIFICVLGATHTVRYYAEHVISDTEAESTVEDGDEHLLITRAQAEAMKELALRGIGKPISLRNGSLGAGVSNSTPSALHRALMESFERQAMR